MTFPWNDSTLPPGLNPAEDTVKDLLEDSSFGNVLSSKPVGKYLTGARCILKINGDLAGFAFSISWRINTIQKEIYTIDSWVPHEIAPRRVSVEGTIGMLHIPGKGPSAELIQSDILSFMFHKYITIEVRDSTTNQVVFQTNKAVITSRYEEIKAEQIASIQLSWKAIGWQDERTPVLPDGVTTGAGNP